MRCGWVIVAEPGRCAAADEPHKRCVAHLVTLPLGWRIALVRAGTAFWSAKGGPGVSQLYGNK
jgi:hypothetical protein